MLDGSFLVFRKLKQKVPEFSKYLKDHALQNAAGSLTVQQGADLLGARMVGRWKSGAPIDLAPTADNAVSNDSFLWSGLNLMLVNASQALGANPQQNNKFDFSHVGSLITTDQTKCPFSAHIRKTRPRADEVNLNFLNHIIRAGIPYGPEVSSSESTAQTTSTDRGLAFGK